MRFGVAGLGSMGQRRVRDLSALGHEVIGFDVRADRMRESTERFGIEAVDSADALADAADAIVVSTPPDRHVQWYELSLQRGKPFFSEASIFTPRAEWFAQRETNSARGYPSATWKYYPLLDVLRDQVAALPETLLSAHHHYGGWLPYWHPWEHYTAFYAGQRTTSAAREMVPFEMEWLCWICGPVRAVSCSFGQAYPWDAAFDDAYAIIVEFENGLRGSINIELFQPAPFRQARLAAKDRSFVLDFGRHELQIYELSTDSWRRMNSPGLRTFSGFNFEDVYAAEIADFARAVAKSEPGRKSWAEDRHLSNILFAAEESARRREWVTIDEAETLYDGLTL